MAIGFYPVFDPEVIGAEFHSEGVELLRSVEILDDLAGEAGVSSFTQFADMRDVPDDFDGSPEELEELLGEWTDWFSPDALRESCDAILPLIQSRHQLAKSLTDRAAIVSELQELARVLALAEAAEARFRLEVVSTA